MTGLRTIPGMSKLKHLSGLLILLVCGCQSTPPPVLLSRVVEDDLAIAPAAPINPPAAAVHLVAEVRPAATAVSAKPWAPIEEWFSLHGAGKALPVLAGATPAYQVQTEAGLFTFKVGTRLAQCNGLDYWLGFAPQLIGGMLHLHTLDTLKNIQPLLKTPQRGWPRFRSIVLDPGHGGLDSGSRSIFNNAPEKEYTLDWALRVRDLLQQAGWQVTLTRSQDRELSLAERVAIADASSADIFLSLHFNSAEQNRTVSGVETYCMTPVGMPSTLVRNYEDDLNQPFPNNNFDEMNLQLAYRLHHHLVKTTGGADRGLRRARFMAVLKNQNRPAALIEGGYLSHAAEARKIASPEYRQVLAEAVAASLSGQ